MLSLIAINSSKTPQNSPGVRIPCYTAHAEGFARGVGNMPQPFWSLKNVRETEGMILERASLRVRTPAPRDYPLGRMKVGQKGKDLFRRRGKEHFLSCNFDSTIHKICGFVVCWLLRGSKAPRGALFFFFLCDLEFRYTSGIAPLLSANLGTKRRKTATSRPSLTGHRTAPEGTAQAVGN